MPSWRARAFAAYVRLAVRRRDWGNEHELARRARWLFGAPRAYQRVVLLGLHTEPVTTPGGVRGEWISTPSPEPGVLFYIHGGGYVSCSSATHRPITAALARALRCRVFAVDYRTAPEARFPAALDDVTAAYQWLVATEPPGTPIAIAGDSAGGGLALALAVHARDAGWPAPACVAALSPWTDLQGTGASLRSNDGRCAMFRPENIPAFASAYLGAAPADDPRASPVCADLSGLPPILLQVGSTELLFDDARRVHESVLAAGGASRFTVYDDVMHGWHLLAPLVPEAREAVREVARCVSDAFAHRPADPIPRRTPPRTASRT